jgi:MFS family permease
MAESAPRRLLLLTSAIVFLDTIFFAAITPLLPRYVEAFGLGKAGAGVLAGAYPAGTLVAALPAIWVAGRIGLRRTVVFGLSLLGASSLAFGLGDSAVALDLARFTQGVSGALCWAGGLGWLVGESPAATRGRTIGLALGAALVGALLGPVLGGAAAALGPAPVFGLVAVASFALAALTVTIPPPGARTPPSMRQVPGAMREPRVRLGLFLVLVFGAGFGATETLGPLQLDEAGLSSLAIAATFLVALSIETALAPVVGRLTDRYGRLAPVRLCLPLGITVLAVLGWATTPALLIALILLAAIGMGPLWAPGSALFSDGADLAGVNQVVAFALSNAAWSLGGLAGSAGGGALAALGSDVLPYSLMAGVLALTLVLVLHGRTLESASTS